jgi:hypothetical protein
VRHDQIAALNNLEANGPDIRGQGEKPWFARRGANCRRRTSDKLPAPPPGAFRGTGGGAPALPVSRSSASRSVSAILPLVRDAANYNDASAVIALFEDAADAVRHSERRDRSVVRLPSRGRLVATGDLHDNPFHLEKIIRLARLDESPDHYVVMHEMIHGERLLNGMDFSYRMLSRVAELIVAHPGQVHSVLANHELAQMTGRGVSKGAGNSVELFLNALDYVFGERALDVAEAINMFIAAMPIALISDPVDDYGGVLCAHSLPMAAMMPHFDVDLFQRDLRDEDYQAPHGSAYLMVWGRQYTVEQIEQLAARWGVKLFCLGHEHAETGIEMRGPRVIILNTDHERATVLPIDLSAVPTAEEAFTYAVPLSALA